MVDVSDDSLYTAWVGSNFKLEGQKAMAWLDAYLEAKGRGDEEINLVDIQELSVHLLRSDVHRDLTMQ